MRRPDVLDGVVVAVAVAVAYVTAPRDESFWLSVAFSTLVLSVLGMLVRLGVHTVRDANRERGRARTLSELDRDDLTRRAVAQERQRLSADLDVSLQDALRRVANAVRTRDAHEDPRPLARQIQAHAREATSELRRQLGLLRAQEAEPASPTRVDRFRPGRPDRRDLLVGALVGILAAAEAGLTPPEPGYEASTGLSVLLTGLAAATTLGRRTHPGTAASVCAAVFGLGWVLPDQSVGSGLWMLWTIGGLVWTLAATRPRLRTLGPVLALGLVACGSRLCEDADNAAILVAVVSSAAMLGAIVGANRRRHHTATARAAALRAELDAARERALTSERHEIARELHDVVSHAVGVIALQAAAAEVSWPDDQETTDRAFTVIGQTAQQALAELGHVAPLDDSPAWGLDALVERMRAGGAQVTLYRDPVTSELEPVVYRIVQEGLTNAVRHAPGAQIRVCVTVVDRAVTVIVGDRGAGRVPRSPAQVGFGLTGLQERVVLRGGRLTAGPDPDGGFTLEARLPLKEGTAP